MERNLPKAGGTKCYKSLGVSNWKRKAQPVENSREVIDRRMVLVTELHQDQGYATNEELEYTKKVMLKKKNKNKKKKRKQLKKKKMQLLNRKKLKR